MLSIYCSGIAMGKNENIFVKLQIEKNSQSGNLTMCIYFDKNSPNFSTEEEGLNWYPTVEEMDFIIETFVMISNCKNQYHRHGDNVKSNETSFSIDKDPEEQSTVKKESNIVADEPFNVNKETEDNHPELSKESKEIDEKIFVQAYEEIFEEALIRKKGEPTDEFIVKEDEKIFIDKVLKQKLKNKK
jgi:hypothetical protein